MASPLDLQEQEQLDQLKDFWRRYGTLITSVLTVILLALAAWNGWNWWQRSQATKAGVLFDEIDKAVIAGDADKAGRVFGDLRDNFGGTVFTAQAALLAAKVQLDKAQAEAAVATLRWAAEKAADEGYRRIAGLRLAGVLLDLGKHEEALAALPKDSEGLFAALTADRRGDILLAQGKSAEAVAAFGQALKAFGNEGDYRRVVEAKLIALGSPLPAAAAASGVAR